MRIIDMHCDTISELMKGKADSIRKNDLMIDLDKLEAGDYLCQCFAMFVHYLRPEMGPDYNPFVYCNRMIDRFYLEMEKNSDRIRPVTTVRQILENRDRGILSALLTIEEGGVCLGHLELLRNFYRLGVRMMTLTWNYRNEIGFPNSDLTPGLPEEEMRAVRDPLIPETERGLTEKGFEFVREMNRLGMVVDCSHLGDKGFYDVLSVSKKPVVCSHSCARALCPHVRNMTDDMLDALKKNGGVVGMNYCTAFVTSEDRMVTVRDLADHMEYIKNRIGVEYLGFGSDFDGISNRTLELKDASRMPELLEELSRRGFSDRDLEKVCFENVLRVWEENFGE
ncbi:MAG: dipeptidase [Clostridia bacterium]|nr:dipeptidase [Clostridia bacterium]